MKQNSYYEISQFIQYLTEIAKIKNQDSKQSYLKEGSFDKCSLLQNNSLFVQLEPVLIHLKQGNITLACEKLLIQSILCPQSMELKFSLGLLYELDNQLQNAYNQYELCVKLDPNHQEAYNSLGQILVIFGQHEAALKSFQRQIQVNQKHIKSFFNLGNIYLSRKQLEDSLINFSICLSLEPLNEEIYIILASIYENQQESNKQINVLQQQLVLFPLSKLKIQFQMGKVNQKIENYKESIDNFEYCSSFNPQDSLLRYQIAHNYEKLGEYDEAIKEFNKCLKLDTKMWVCYFHLGFLYKKICNIQGSKQMFQKGLHHNSDHVRGLFEMGLILMKEKDYSNALIFLEKSLLLCDLQYDIYSVLARVYSKLNMLEYSFSCIKVSQFLLPNDVSQKLIMLNILLKKEYYSSVIRMSVNINTISSKDSMKFNQIVGEAYFRQQNWDIAIKFFLNYLKLGGKHIKLQMIKDDFWALINSSAKPLFVQFLLSYVEKCRDFLDEAHLLLCETYMHNDLDFEKAKMHLNEVIGKNQIQFQISMAKYELFGLNDLDQAKNRLLLINQKSICEFDTQYKLLMAELYFKQMEFSQVSKILASISLHRKFEEDIRYLEGMNLLKQNKIAEAINRLKLNQSHSQSFYQLGIISRDERHYIRARSYFFRSIRNSPDNPLYLKAIIEMELSLKNNTLINKYLEQYSTLAKDNITMLYTLADAYIEIKQFQLASKYIERIKNLDHSHSEIKYREAAIKLELGFFQEALDLLNNFIQIKQDNFNYFFMLGKCTFHLNQNELAIQSLTKCLALKPDHIESLNMLGKINLKMNKIDSAEKLFQNKLFSQNQDVETSIEIGNIYWKNLKNFEQAEVYLKRSVLIDRNSITNLTRFITFYIDWKNWKELDDLILNNKYSKKVYETSDGLLLFIGNSYFERNHSQAINFYLKAFKLNDYLREPHLKIAQLQFINQDFKKSFDSLTMAQLPSRKKESIQFDLLYLKAKLLVQNDNEMKALPLLQKCLKLRPENEHLYFEISFILHKCKSKKASEYFKKGKIINQTTELGLIMEGLFLFESFLNQDGFSCLFNCMKLYPQSQICYFYLGEFNLKMNNWEKAKGFFEECLKMKCNLNSIHSKPLSSIDILDCKIGLSFALKQLNQQQEAYDLAISTYQENTKYFKSIKLLSELLIMRGEISESIRLCQKYLIEKPDDTEAHYTLANARILKKDADIAIPSLLQCKKLNPNYPDINLRLGEAYEEGGNHMSAFDSYNNHLNLEPTCKKALLKYIQYSSILTSFKHAHIGLNKLLRLYPRDSDAYFAEGQLNYHEGNITSALSLIEESVRLDPQEGTKVVYLIHLYQINGNHEKQIEIYNKLINSNPNNCNTLTNIGSLYIKVQKYDEARESYIKCVTIDRFSAEHHSNLGLAYYAKFEYSLALESFENAISIKPDHINSLYSIALTLNSMGNTQQAIISFQKCIKMHPYFLKAYISLAKLQIKQNMLQNALQTCQESLERRILNIVLKQEDAYNSDIEDIECIHSLISVIYGKKKDYLNQIDELLKCLKYSPQNMKYLNSLALAYANQQDNQKASSILIQLTNMDPHNITILFNLAEIYHRIKQFPQEIETLSKCIQLNSFFEKAYINLSIAYFSMNDIPNTISTYLQCIGIFPTNFDAYFNLGNVYSSLNSDSSNSLAISSYEKAIFLNPNHLPSLNNIALIYIKRKQYYLAITCFEKCIIIDHNKKQAYKNKIQIISSLQKN